MNPSSKCCTGEISVRDGKIVFRNCDSLTVLVAAGTNYLNQRDSF